MVALRQHRGSPGARHAGGARAGRCNLSPARSRPGPAPRVAVLLACAAAWLWAWSIYTPWATDLAPRLWLYDLLYYLRAALAAWTLAECAHWAWHPARRTRLGSLSLGIVLLAGTAGWAYAHAGIGWRLRVLASAEPLAALATQGSAAPRQRAGHVLVDTLRMPCDAATPWFWLGRPHGAGSGINLALIRSASAPQAPFAAAFRIRHVAGDWWMAYQNGRRYQALQGQAAMAACTVPRRATSHRDGMAFIDAG